MLSSWDTLAFDEHGVSTNGVFTTPAGVTVRFRKNWLCIYDELGWIAGAFDKPMIMHVDAGDFHYRDLHVHAVHGPWNGIYAVCCAGSYAASPDNVFACMAGIACYGWDNDKWIGISKNAIKFMQSWLRRRFTEYDLPPEVRNIQLEKMLRFNQGDRFISEQTGIDLLLTHPGSSPEPLIMNIIGAHGKTTTE